MSWFLHSRNSLDRIPPFPSFCIRNISICEALCFRRILQTPGSAIVFRKTTGIVSMALPADPVHGVNDVRTIQKRSCKIYTDIPIPSSSAFAFDAAWNALRLHLFNT